MKVRVLIALGLALSALRSIELGAVAQQATDVAVVGRVVDATTGLGIGGATVRVSLDGDGSRPGAVLTTEKGSFLFRLPFGTRITVRALKPGFFGGEYLQWGPRLPGESLIVPKQKEPLQIVIPMWRGGVVTGRVWEPSGDPAVAVRVVAFRRDASNGIARFVRTATSTTDDRGMYRIPGLTPGAYVVGVLSGQAGNTGFLTYAPSTSFPSAASIASVAPGAESTGVDVVLPTGLQLNLSGRLAGYVDWKETDRVTLNPVDPGAPVGDVAMASVPVDEAGKFVFAGVPSGRYVVRFLRMPKPQGGVTQSDMRVSIRSLGQPVPRMTSEPTWWGESVVELSDQSLDVTLAIRRGARVSGRIRFAPGTPQPPQEALARAMVLVVRADGASLGQMPPAAIDLDGRFTSAELPPGHYSVAVPSFLLLGLMTESIEVAGQEAATVEVGSDDVTTVSIAMTSRLAELREPSWMSGTSRHLTSLSICFRPTVGSGWVTPLRASAPSGRNKTANASSKVSHPAST